MESGESPLDVLSRAATMLQENQAAMADEPSKQASTKQLPTTKWKRDRRSRAEYSRKSHPKLPENFGMEQASGSEKNSTNGQLNGSQADAPLDMSVRQRGQPPSYSQTINNPGYRSNYRPSVIAHGPPPRDDLPSGISMCDPIIDEHFRRSLGQDYLKIFSNNNINESNPAKSLQKVTCGNVVMDGAGLSVDDHFAKALGDTWLKLNKKESEIESSVNEKQSVSV